MFLDVVEWLMDVFQLANGCLRGVLWLCSYGPMDVVDLNNGCHRTVSWVSFGMASGCHRGVHACHRTVLWVSLIWPIDVIALSHGCVQTDQCVYGIRSIDVIEWSHGGLRSGWIYIHLKLYARFLVLGIASIKECFGPGGWRAQGYLAQRGEAFFLHNGEKKSYVFRIHAS